MVALVCIHPADIGLSGGLIFLEIINVAAASTLVSSGVITDLCDAIFYASFILMNDQTSSFLAQDPGSDGRCFMDAVSDILRVVRLGGAVYLNENSPRRGA
jgi:hypothetical protein